VKTNKIRSRSLKLGCRFSNICLFLFLACALITARKYVNFKEDLENLRTDDRNTNDGAGIFLRNYSRTLFHAFLTMFARVRFDGVSENGSREFARRSGNLICADKNIPYARILYDSLWFPRMASGLCPVSLCLRYKSSPASASVRTLAGSDSVIRLFSSTPTWHSTPSDLWIPSYRASSRPLFSREISSSLGTHTRRGINLVIEKKSQVPLYSRNRGERFRFWHIY